MAIKTNVEKNSASAAQNMMQSSRSGFACEASKSSVLQPGGLCPCLETVREHAREACHSTRPE